MLSIRKNCRGSPIPYIFMGLAIFIKEIQEIRSLNLMFWIGLLQNCKKIERTLILSFCKIIGVIKGTESCLTRIINVTLKE